MESLPKDEPKNDKPFDDTPFDAGVEADEESDPKKFIEQLTGKLGQSLRKYTEEQGQPDFELEKFAINSLLSATHTGEMDSEDQNDIIKKVKSSGEKDSDNTEPESNDKGDSNDLPDSEPTENPSDEFSQDDTEGVDEQIVTEKNDNFLIKPKKLSIFAPEGSEESNFKHKIMEKLNETFKQESLGEPMVEPNVKPDTTPVITPDKPVEPRRKDKPFLPMPEVKPDPKASKK